jgi:hypothetical protein
MYPKIQYCSCLIVVVVKWKYFDPSREILNKTPNDHQVYKIAKLDIPAIEV